MASSTCRFVKFSETEVKSFSEEQQNVNTKKKTLYDLKLFNDFLASEETREIEEIPVAELQALAIKFLLGFRKKNGNFVFLVYIIKRTLHGGEEI